MHLLLTVSALLSRSLIDSSSSMSYSPLPVDNVPDTLLVFCLTTKNQKENIHRVHVNVQVQLYYCENDEWTMHTLG